MERQAQILIGREYGEGETSSGRGVNIYQLMINWEPKRDSSFLNVSDEGFSVMMDQEIASSLSEELKRNGINTCRIYNGVRYDNETKRFAETDEPLSQLEESAIRQTLKIVGGILAA